MSPVVPPRTLSVGPLDAQAFLDAAGTVKKTAIFRKGQCIYSHGDPCEHVLYLQEGRVQLRVVSPAGRQAVRGMLHRGDFFGEGCLAGHVATTASATALTDVRVLLVEKSEMEPSDPRRA